MDAIIIEGAEAGGHIGKVNTMAIVPQVVEALDIPVIAAGGIGDGKGLLAALSLGAEAVQVGTRFICSTEAAAHENYKRFILEAKDADTIIYGGRAPVRAIGNEYVEKYIQLKKDGASQEDLDKLDKGRLKLAAYEGDRKEGSFIAGQISGMINEIKPSKEIIEDMLKGMEEQFKVISSTLNP